MFGTRNNIFYVQIVTWMRVNNVFVQQFQQSKKSQKKTNVSPMHFNKILLVPHLSWPSSNVKINCVCLFCHSQIRHLKRLFWNVLTDFHTMLQNTKFNTVCLWLFSKITKNTHMKFKITSQKKVWQMWRELVQIMFQIIFLDDFNLKQKSKNAIQFTNALQ